MLKIKEGNKKCENCERFKLKAVKTEKHYLIYECEECKTRYQECKITSPEIMEDIIKFIRDNSYNCFSGRSTKESDTYYICLQSRQENSICYLLTKGEYRKQILVDASNPKFKKQVLKILKEVKNE